MKRHQFLQPLVDLLDLKKQNWRMILLMILVTILVSAPVYARQVRVLQNDYKLHIEFTNLLLNRQFQEEPAAVYAHPLYQLLLIGLYSLTLKKIGLFGLAFLVQIAIQVVTVVIIYYLLGKPPKQGWDWFRAVLAITLVLVAPVMLLAFWDRLFYLGYIGLEIFHNPTTPLLRPIALASFICAVPAFSASRSPWKLSLLSAFLIIASALIKPNYALCILPALGLMAVVLLVAKKPVDLRLLIFGFFVPGVLVLAIQWLVTYFLPGEAEGRIFFDFLGVMKGYSNYLLPKFLLSILFPLTVLVVNFRKLARDNGVLLAWAGFLVALVQMYCLAESGDRYTDGNFLWGAQIMLFILFVISVRFLWQEKIAPGLLSVKTRELIAYFAYALHLLAGIAYYVYAFITISRPPF